MKKTKKKDANGTKLMYLFIIVVAFMVAFIVLINRQKEDTYLADVEVSSFHVKPEVGKVIVAKDNYAIYPKYYVVNVSGGHYAIYVYNYYETVSQYNLEFNQLIDKIVDYNAKDKMIRYIHSQGYGSYEGVLSKLPTLVNNNNLTIY